MNPPALTGARRGESDALEGVPLLPKLLPVPIGPEFSLPPPARFVVDGASARGCGITTPADRVSRTSVCLSRMGRPPVGRSHSVSRRPAASRVGPSGIEHAQLPRAGHGVASCVHLELPVHR